MILQFPRFSPVIGVNGGSNEWRSACQESQPQSFHAVDNHSTQSRRISAYEYTRPISW